MNAARKSVVGILFLVAWTPRAFAQEAGAFAADHFEPLPGATKELGSVATSETLSHLTPSVSLTVHFADDVLQIVEGDNVTARLIDERLVLEPAVAIGLFDFFQLGVTIPAIVYQTGDAFDGVASSTLKSAALGDLRIVPKAQILRPDVAAGFGIGLLVPIGVPTGDQDSFASDGGVRAEPRLVFDYRHDSGFLVAVNVGFLVRPERSAGTFVSGNAVKWGAGLTVPLADPVALFGTVFGSASVAQGIDAETLAQTASNATAHPAEWNAGFRFFMPAGVMAQVAAGTGLTNGVGAPDFRVFGTLAWSPSDDDRDGDGIRDSKDECPDDPGPVENNGCPYKDTDGDGLLDPDDACPEIPGPIENKGCPYADTDGDGVVDAQDKCPEVPGPVENDGCPYEDTDGDGILDNVDKCPTDPEDKDGFQDEDGCPDVDNDKDGILDNVDKCPNDPETINGVDDDDGCPDEGQSKVRLTDKKIEILDKVYFDTNKATIRPESFNLLQQVGATLRANRQLIQIQIEGHTDNVGSDTYNQTLSQERAASVRQFLIDYGIEANRLRAIGFGETTPIAPNSSKAGRDQNRRVEFNIVKTAEETP